ncbi:MAG TPA: hypothetical protein VKM55_20350 [Candidatus Lokiarchaeia archaeon]|nr:hypothetical protein [Candidatus Lokiarchaeia archaeon]
MVLACEEKGYGDLWQLFAEGGITCLLQSLYNFIETRREMNRKKKQQLTRDFPDTI